MLQKKLLESLTVHEKNNFCKKFELCKTIELKTIFLVSHIEEKPVAEFALKRRFSRVYRVGSKRVCQQSFREILGISNGTISRALLKFHEGSLEDNRGVAYNVLSNESRAMVVNHIESFPRYISHYRRETSSALYLDPELTHASMYRLFLEKMQEDHPEILKLPSQSSYDKIFHSLGYKIKNLKADTCKSCDVFHCQITNAGSEA